MWMCLSIRVAQVVGQASRPVPIVLGYGHLSTLRMNGSKVLRMAKPHQDSTRHDSMIRLTLSCMAPGGTTGADGQNVLEHQSMQTINCEPLLSIAHLLAAYQLSYLIRH